MSRRRVPPRAWTTAALVAAVATGAVLMADAILHTAIETRTTLDLIEEGRSAW